MSEGEAEKKKIAELRFGIGEAEANLKVIDEKLEAISKKADKLDLGKNLKVDTTKIKSSYQNLDEMVNKYGKNVTNTYLKGVTEAEKAEHAKELAGYKHMLKMEEYNARIQKNTKSMYDKITEYAKTYLIYQAFNQLKRAAGEVIEEMKEVEYSMVSIDRVLNESSLDIDHYRDKLIQLAHDYGNSFDNVADITLRLAQAGFDSQEALALTEKTLLALNTAELNATQATDDMVSVMSQWNLMTGTATEQADAYGSIIDKVNKVADNFPTTSADIMDALKKVSSAFNLAGASIDETIATIVAAEKASQRGGKVIGTALSNITQQLKAEGKLNLAEEMGLDFFTDDAKTTFKPIMEIFQEMAERMEKLKAEGKESSVEMQNLLELFTVFRRNIGASLLGEMSGEDSTYMKALETSINSLGYSMQENEKYMRTAKAAQEQFNATLLQLKTSVWDNGLEDVFRSMLMLGNDVAKAIKLLIDNFGALPTAVGAATLAFSTFQKQIKIQSVDGKFAFGFGGDFVKKIKEAKEEVNKILKPMETFENSTVQLSESMEKYVDKVGIANVSTKGYIGNLLKMEAAEKAAEITTIALNTALSLGLSAGITLIITGLDKLIHAEENAAKAAQERVNTAKDLLDDYEKERNSIDDLIKQYEELEKKSSRTPEEELKIYEIQTQINTLIKDQKQSIDLVNGAYDETIRKLKQISKEERERSLKQAEIAMKETKKQAENYGNFGLETFRGGFQNYGIDLAQLQNEILPGTIFQKSIDEILKAADYETTIRLLEEFEEKLEDAGDTSSDMYYKIIEDLKTMYGLQKNVNESTDTYNNILAESKIDEMFPEGTIKNIEDYKNALEQINSSSALDGLKENMTFILAKTFPEFAKKNEELKNGIVSTNVEFTNFNNEMTKLQTQYTALISAQNELNNSGQLTISTFKSLVDNNLLQYLDIVNGKLVLNETSFINLANAAKEDAKAKLQDQTASNILAIVEKDLGDQIDNVTDKQEDVAESTKNDTELKKANMKAALANAVTHQALAESYENERKAQEGASAGAINWAGLSKEATDQIQKEIDNLRIYTAAIDKVNLTRASVSSGSASAAENAAKRAQQEAERAAEEAAKKAEEIYKNSLSSFEDYMTEFERLEKRWVTKQKDLGLLNTDDYMYITEQRIKRYQEYLRAVKDAGWLKDEDRLELEKKYTEGIEDLQVEYLEYVKDKLDEEIKAYEEANEKKIDLIKEEADARINALRTTEKETDRIREKEEYQRKREEHLNDISYWEQRTGREAQEALLEARKNLEELDREWNEKQEDWSLDDQIKAIEEQRDAEIKAIEDAQQSEIDAMKAVYDAKVQMFTESGQIIYENSVIQSRNLFNAYKSNFIDPVSNELTKLNQSLSTTTTQTSAEANTGSTAAQQYETYTIKSGDTLTKIARQYGTSIEKILEANPYVTNRNLIYTGKTLQIPKFHEGGIYGGAEEGLAILKRGEMVFKPEWSAGINRMIKYLDNIRTGNTTNISNGPSISVSGDLVRIEASVRNQNDIDALGRKVEKILKDKFNIKK